MGTLGVALGWVSGWRGWGICFRCASPFGQPLAGYLPLVGSRSDDEYFGGGFGVGERVEGVGHLLSLRFTARATFGGLFPFGRFAER
jgi:hypothetical protein